MIGYRIQSRPHIGVLGTTQFPDRKRPSLIISRGTDCLVLASFYNQEAVAEFEKWMDEMIEEVHARILRP